MSLWWVCLPVNQHILHVIKLEQISCGMYSMWKMNLTFLCSYLPGRPQMKTSSSWNIWCNASKRVESKVNHLSQDYSTFVNWCGMNDWRTRQSKACWLAEPANLIPMARQHPAMMLALAWLLNYKTNNKNWSTLLSLVTYISGRELMAGTNFYTNLTVS